MTQRVGNIWPLCDGRKGLSIQVAEGVKGWRFDGVFGVAKHVGGRHRLLQEQFFRTVSCRWWYGSARYGRLPAKKTARVLRVCNGYWGWAATRQPGRCSINYGGRWCDLVAKMLHDQREGQEGQEPEGKHIFIPAELCKPSGE